MGDVESLAICTIIKNEAPYIDEWVEFHAGCGAAKFLIYDNLSSDETALRIAKLQKRHDIEWVVWRDRMTWIHTQRAAYSDALGKLRSKVHFAAFIDVDEFLYSPSGSLLTNVLSHFGSHVGAIGVNQLVFGSSGLREYTSAPVVRRFKWRAMTTHPESKWYKSIVRPEMAIFPETAHNFRLKEGVYVHADGSPLVSESEHPGVASQVCTSSLVINHYLLKSWEEYNKKRQRWFGTSLEQRYNEEYFRLRDSYANLVEDTTLAALHENMFA